MRHLPIHDSCCWLIFIAESTLLSCGITTALKPNTRPVLIVPNRRKEKRWRLIKLNQKNKELKMSIVLQFTQICNNCGKNLTERFSTFTFVFIRVCHDHWWKVWCNYCVRWWCCTFRLHLLWWLWSNNYRLRCAIFIHQCFSIAKVKIRRTTTTQHGSCKKNRRKQSKTIRIIIIKNC